MAGMRSGDIKKVLAYSSIVHMNACLIALFTGTKLGLLGCFLRLITHAFTVSLLFFVAGMFYDRIRTRNFLYFSPYSADNNLFPA